MQQSPCKKYAHRKNIHILIKTIVIAIDLLRVMPLPMHGVPVPRNNEEGVVSGFGIVKNVDTLKPNTELQTTYLTVMRDDQCPITNFQEQAESNFCAGDAEMHTRLCRGDTGSAFVILQRGKPVLVSISFFARYFLSNKCIQVHVGWMAVRADGNYIICWQRNVLYVVFNSVRFPKHFATMLTLLFFLYRS